MNRIISINIRGLIFQIEEDAYERLNQYFKKLKAHFRDQKGSDEIMDDIETRVAEMLSRDPGIQGVVNILRVEVIIEQMGDPSQFEEEEAAPDETYYKKRRRVLYRNGENKTIAGVCSGIAAYFDIDPLLVRIGFLFAFFTFGTGFLLYIILWALIPEARTASEKLEMRGEKVTIDSIERSVKDEFERIKKNFDDPSFRQNAKQTAKQVGKGLNQTFGTFVQFLKRAIGFSLVAFILFVLVAACLAYFGLVTDRWQTPFFPFFDNLFDKPLYTAFFKVCLGLLFLIPLLALLYSGVRLLLAIPGRNIWASRIFTSLWLIALGGTMILAFNLADGWRDHATLSKEQTLATTDTLSIESTNISVYGEQEYVLEFGRSRGIRGIYAIENDSLKRPVQLNILPAEGKEIYLKSHRHSNGPDYTAAAELASHIDHPLYISKGKLLFNPYYAVPSADVWKNQRLIYDLYVPEGIVIAFGKNTSTFLKHISTDNYIQKELLEGKSFRMTRNGLEVKAGDNIPHDEGTTLHYSGFDEINLNGIPEAMIYYSPEFKVTCSSGHEFTPDVHQNGTEISFNLQEGFMSKSTGVLRIGLPYLKHLTVNGGTTVSLDLDKQDNVSIKVNGAAVLEGSIRSHKLNIESNGLNSCRLSGSCYDLDLEINGAGDFNLKELSSDVAQVSADGGGLVQVTVQKSLSARAAGLSTINYYGEPAIRENKAIGNGKIVKAG